VSCRLSISAPGFRNCFVNELSLIETIMMTMAAKILQLACLMVTDAILAVQAQDGNTPAG